MVDTAEVMVKRWIPIARGIIRLLRWKKIVKPSERQEIYANILLLAIKLSASLPMMRQSPVVRVLALVA